MLQIENITLTDRAWAIFRQERARHQSISDLSIVLYYMPSFTNPDGTDVAGFAPGYTIDFVTKSPPGDHWIVAKLPDGTTFQFMPKFTLRPDEFYVVDQVSAYTLSIGPIATLQR